MYRRGIEWIAFNDNAGDVDAFDIDTVSGYLSVALLADITDHDTVTVAKAVVRHRRLYLKCGGGV